MNKTFTQEEKAILKQASSILGRLGGAAGRGAVKARTREQAQKAARTRWANYRANQKQGAL
jgi:hypothetical protein